MREFPLDTRGTGKGKTTRAIMTLRQELEERYGRKYKAAFYLTPYSTQKQQILFSNDFAFHVQSLPQYLEDKNSTRTVIATYAAMNSALKDGLDISDCLLTFDEVPRFIDFMSYQEQLGELIMWLTHPDLFEKIGAYGLTGTPEMLLQYINGSEGLPFKFTEDTKREPTELLAEKGEFVNQGSALSYCRNMVAAGWHSSALVYVDGAQSAYNICRMLRENGLRAEIIISRHNDTPEDASGIPLNQLMTRNRYDGRTIVDWIDERQDIPPCLDALIINSAACDGINIRDESSRIQNVIIESPNVMNIRQARARVRHNVENLVVIYNEKNRKSAIKNLVECERFLQTASPQDYEKRFQQQVEQARAYNEWKSKPKSQRTEVAPEVLDFVVYHCSRGYFTNPFISGLVRYEYNNFIFRREINEQGNTFIDNMYSLGHPMLTKNEFVHSLGSLLESGSFRWIDGSSIVTEARNSLAREEVAELLHLHEGKAARFTNDELKYRANKAGLVTKSRHPAGVPTFLRQVERYCTVSKPKQSTDGTRFREICLLPTNKNERG